MAKISTINLKEYNLQSNDLEGKKQVGQLLVDAFSQFGVVRLEGTGLGLKNDIVKNTHRVFKKVFSSSDGEKNSYSVKANLHGYLISLKDTVEVTQGNPNHREEHFVIRGAACTVDDTDQYPWPDDLSPGFSMIVKEFMAKCESLTLVVLEALALGLGLDQSHFTKVHSSMHSSDTVTFLACTNYTCDHGPDHNDLWHEKRNIFGTMALIFQDEMGGIDFKNFEDDKYIYSGCGNDDVYVVVGDVLEIWTNGILKAVEYRKVVTSDDKGNKPACQTLTYVAGSDFAAVACDLKIKSDKPMEITIATNDEQLTAKKVFQRKLAPISDAQIDA